MSKYYITIDKNDVIWGCGESPEQSLLDAKNNLGKPRAKLKTLKCTKELSDVVGVVPVVGTWHGGFTPRFVDPKQFL